MNQQATRMRMVSRPRSLRGARGVGQIPLVLFCAAAIFGLAVWVASAIGSLDEAGFGDSYILETVRSFQRTGLIYAPVSATTALPGYSQYGPFLYLLLALPGEGANPYLGARIVEMLSFLACIALLAWIGKKLLPGPSGWAWCAALGLSFWCMKGWVLQLRGDFPATALNLLAIRLLMSRKRSALALGGMAAGMALLFKFIYVAALGAGILWLLMRKRWKDAAIFAGAGAATATAASLLILSREPLMMMHQTVLRALVIDVHGLYLLLVEISREPVLIMALGGMTLALARFPRRWMLLALYFGISFAIATVTCLQAGGNTNYYFESLFALTPFAAWFAVQARARRNLAAAAVAGFVALAFAAWKAPEIHASINSLATVQAKNTQLLEIAQAAKGRHVLSFEPGVTALLDEKIVTEPALLSYLHLLGRYDLEPLAARVRSGEFGAVVASQEEAVYRQVPRIAPPLKRALRDGYAPLCVFGDRLILLPRTPRADDSLASRFESAGCRPCDEETPCRSW